jgi:hypothetical protein
VLRRLRDRRPNPFGLSLSKPTRTSYPFGLSLSKPTLSLPKRLARTLASLALWSAVALATCLPTPTLANPTAAAPDTPPLPPVTVYAPSPCLACIDWAEHLRRHGFTVTIEDRPQAEMPRVKRWLNVPSALESVHTARVAGYFLEGHVPAADVLMLLRERPKALGLAVPGLPRGAPGRESYTPVCDTACTILDTTGQAARESEVRREAFNTLLVLKGGRTSIYARH